MEMNKIINVSLLLLSLSIVSCSKSLLSSNVSILRLNGNEIRVNASGVRVETNMMGGTTIDPPENCKIKGGPEFQYKSATDPAKDAHPCDECEKADLKALPYVQGSGDANKQSFSYTFKNACTSCEFVAVVDCSHPSEAGNRKVVERVVLGPPNQNNQNNNENTGDDTTITLEAPSNLTVTGTTSSSVSLSWDDNSDDEDGFKLERSGDGGVTWFEILSSSADVTSYTDNGGLFSATSYDYRVKAFNSERESAYSNTVTGTTAIAPADPPFNLTATAIGSNQINLTWTDNFDEDGYEVFRSTTMGGPYSSIGTTPQDDFDYQDMTAASNTTYYYVVQATKMGAPNSSDSNEASATTDP